MKCVVLVVIFLALLPAVHGQAVEVSVYPERTIAHADTTATLSITIGNNLGEDGAFTINARGDQLIWRNPAYILVHVPAGEEKTISEEFFMKNAKPGEYQFTYVIESFHTGDVGEGDFIIEVLPAFYLDSFSAQRIGERVDATLVLDSKDAQTAEVVFEVLDEVGDVIATVASEEAVDGVTTIETSVPLPLTHPGQYSVRASVEGEVAEIGFSIPVERSIHETRDVISTFWYDEVIITLTNTGNVPTTYTTQEVSIPGDLVTGLVTAPVGCSGSGPEQSCAYEVSVPPGETREIRYRTEFGPAIARVIMGMLIVVVLGTFTIVSYRKPRVQKKYRAGKKMTSIVLKVKNRTGTASNVVVRDWVSPLGKVVMEEFEAIRPVVRRSDAGTELVWKLGDMKAGDERLVSYKIKHMVAGNLRMPRATLRYKTKRGANKRIRSNTLSIRR